MHWIEALEAYEEGETVKLHRYDGSKIVYEPDVEVDEDDYLVVAIGKMIHAVLIESIKAGVFDRTGWKGTVQLDIEDFDGGWGWPDYDDLGKTNLV